MTRPLERTVLRLQDEGMGSAEIGRRLRRRPETVERVAAMAKMRDGSAPLQGDVLRPLERRVLWWRARGESHADIAARFRHSPGFIEQVETLSLYKLNRP